MKYIKTYEGQKYLKPNVKTKFTGGDYVCFIQDYVNGYKVNGISKRTFKVTNIIKNKEEYLYFLRSLNNKSFNWVNESFLRLATLEDIKREEEQIEIEDDLDKYNL
jgi:hypothetical protein